VEKKEKICSNGAAHSGSVEQLTYANSKKEKTKTSALPGERDNGSKAFWSRKSSARKNDLRSFGRSDNYCSNTDNPFSKSQSWGKRKRGIIKLGKITATSEEGEKPLHESNLTQQELMKGIQEKGYCKTIKRKRNSQGSRDRKGT